MALRVIDRAVQVHGAAGVSQDTPLAASWAFIRTLRIADGPDEVHRRTVARLERREMAERLAGSHRETGAYERVEAKERAHV
jgi:acyl-CoA dehydrogenase